MGKSDEFTAMWYCGKFSERDGNDGESNFAICE